MRSRWMPAMLCLALAASVGCGAAAHPGGDDPQSVLHAYARFLQEGRADEAYRLLRTALLQDAA